MDDSKLRTRYPTNVVRVWEVLTNTVRLDESPSNPWLFTLLALSTKERAGTPALRQACRVPWLAAGISVGSCGSLDGCTEARKRRGKECEYAGVTTMGGGGGEKRGGMTARRLFVWCARSSKAADFAAIKLPDLGAHVEAETQQWCGKRTQGLEPGVTATIGVGVFGSQEPIKSRDPEVTATIGVCNCET
ncbi:hypothetical protein B0H11DRAFT_1921311 [Mycena galericulata]|nr:hypothetical protein B0H11DRAFT_1921311 [Mycena galericulata]